MSQPASTTRPAAMAGRTYLARIICPRSPYYAGRPRFVSRFCVYQADHADVDGENAVVAGHDPLGRGGDLDVVGFRFGEIRLDDEQSDALQRVLCHAHAVGPDFHHRSAFGEMGLVGKAANAQPLRRGVGAVEHGGGPRADPAVFVAEVPFQFVPSVAQAGGVAGEGEIDHVCERIREFNYKVHSIEGEERVVIGVVGVGDVTACLESLEATPGVESAMRISAPYKFVSKEFKPEHTVLRVNGLEIGGDEFIVIAGPCSVESERQIMETPEGRAAAGARMLRGGAFKPRTSPYDFQGMELEGLKLLRKAKQATGLAIVTEVMSDSDVGMVAEYTDVMQVGARNMQNFALLKSLGGCGRPVLLKRGMS